MLTIGIPFYNNEKTLADAVKSVFAQTFTDWELILADDGSKDGSLAVAKTFEQMDGRIKVVSDGVNRGISYRLNLIASLAKGDYIARMDADDMMMPDRIEKQMTVLLADTSIDVIDTAAYVINEKGEPVGIRGTDDLSNWNMKLVLTKGLFFHPAVIAKACWFRENKYAEKYLRTEDFELWCRTFDKTVFTRIREPLIIYREGRVNIKNYTSSARVFREVLRIYDKGVLSKKEFYFEIAKSYLKSNLYRTFALFNAHHALSSARNTKLSDKQKQKLTAAIQQIKNCDAIKV